MLDASVVLLHRVVEEPARRRDLVFDVGQLGLKLLEVLVGLEVRIGLREREHLPERAGQHVLRCRLLRRTLGGDRGVPRLHHRFKRAALMGGISLYRLDQVRDQVVAAPQLHIDLGPCLVDAVTAPNEAVVGDGDEEGHEHHDRHEDPHGGHERILETDLDTETDP